MFRKILTHLIIFMLTVLPVQVISADVKNSGMKTSMQKKIHAVHECIHGSTEVNQQIKNNGEHACCDSLSHQCDNCVNCSQAVTTPLLLIVINQPGNTELLISQKYFSSHLLLSGVIQQDLLRPPRNFI
ncbi:MAG: hypothetical protein OEY78_08610 [Gammaproteobacteria bacterium]|nr:hypothetical protein [Gammaproteobacteria bacterium]